jgi:hypothetical protein
VFHNRRTCPKLQRIERQVGSRVPSEARISPELVEHRSRAWKKRRCSVCGARGHDKRNCPEKVGVPFIEGIDDGPLPPSGPPMLPSVRREVHAAPRVPERPGYSIWALRDRQTGVVVDRVYVPQDYSRRRAPVSEGGYMSERQYAVREAYRRGKGMTFAERESGPGGPVRRRNPIRFTGPSLTFMPFSPFQKVAIDFFGASYDPSRKKNPYQRWSHGSHSGHEVPEYLWPEHMHELDFNHWAESRSMPLSNLDRFYKSKHDGQGFQWHTGGRDLHAAFNDYRASQGQNTLTFEEWRRREVIDLVEQLYDVEEMRAPYRGTRYERGPMRGKGDYPFAWSNWVKGAFGRPSETTGEDADEIRRQLEVAKKKRRKGKSSAEAARQSRIAAIRETIGRQEAAKSGAATGKDAVERVAALIRGLVHAFGNDRDELAAELGVSRAQVVTWLNARQGVSAAWVKRIEKLAADNGVGLENPSVPRMRNRDHRWRKHPKIKKVPIEEIEDMPGFAEALKKFRRFHKKDPEFAKVAIYDDGEDEVSLAGNTVHVFLGKREQTPYTVPFGSKKDVRWYHDHPKGEEPSMLLNPRTGLVTDVGGAYLVDDWFYS